MAVWRKAEIISSLAFLPLLRKHFFFFAVNKCRIHFLILKVLNAVWVGCTIFSSFKATFLLLIIVPDITYLDGRKNVWRTEGCADAILLSFHYCVLSKALIWNCLAGSLYYAAGNLFTGNEIWIHREHAAINKLNRVFFSVGFPVSSHNIDGLESAFGSKTFSTSEQIKNLLSLSDPYRQFNILWPHFSKLNEKAFFS